MNNHRKLLIHAVNKLIGDGIITLDCNEDEDTSGHILTKVANEQSLVSWKHIGFGEVRVTVWWKYDQNNHPRLKHEHYDCRTPITKPQNYRKFVGAIATGYLERKVRPPYIQGGRSGESNWLPDMYTRQSDRYQLDQMADPKPNGFEPTGKRIF